MSLVLRCPSSFGHAEESISESWVGREEIGSPPGFGKDGCVNFQSWDNGIQTLVFTVLLDVPLDFLGDFYERFPVIWKILDIALGSHLLEEVALL